MYRKTVDSKTVVGDVAPTRIWLGRPSEGNRGHPRCGSPLNTQGRGPHTLRSDRRVCTVLALVSGTARLLGPSQHRSRPDSKTYPHDWDGDLPSYARRKSLRVDGPLFYYG